MTEAAPAAGLPMTHIGIHAGPVISQDGDVYGRTVNVASRIADLAGPGEILTTVETARQVEGLEVEWTEVGPVQIQGLAQPVLLARAGPR
jgi:adenylate cyclase